MSMFIQFLRKFQNFNNMLTVLKQRVGNTVMTFAEQFTRLLGLVPF